MRVANYQIRVNWDGVRIVSIILALVLVLMSVGYLSLEVGIQPPSIGEDPEPLPEPSEMFADATPFEMITAALALMLFGMVNLFLAALMVILLGLVFGIPFALMFDVDKQDNTQSNHE